MLGYTGPRWFIVCDIYINIKPVDHNGKPTIYAGLIKRWEKAGATIQDAAAIISHLAEYGPLVMVVYSGNISLQGRRIALSRRKNVVFRAAENVQNLEPSSLILLLG